MPRSGIARKHSKEPTHVEVSEHAQYHQPSVNTRLQHATTSLRRRSGNFLASMPAPVTGRFSESQRKQSLFIALLPPDLHYIIATKYLDFDTLLALRQTCHMMRRLLTPDQVRRVRSKLIQGYLEDEARQFQDYRIHFPPQRLGHLWDLLHAAFDFRLLERPARELRCYGCLQMKPLWCFVERMSSRGTGLGAKSAHDRMCKACMSRYRDIEGQWWKENWVKKSETARKASKGRRLRRWALEGKSLVNPPQEVGVCAACGGSSFELWWGCVACFEAEQKARREEDLDLMEMSGLERKIVDAFDAWRCRREMKYRQRQAKRERRPLRNRLLGTLGFPWTGGLSDRKAALEEWKESKTNPGATFSKSGRGTDSGWRAIDQAPLPKSRREARCATCWIPGALRRMYMLGFAYEGALDRERWCQGCQQDQELRHARRVERKMRLDGKIEDEETLSDCEDYGLFQLFEEE
ncbi:hypothetical protein PV05_05525 [Exophiala xenobiotica]|uniref:F-box domain-containing protein n=1 Tax=Exophiala xenobiotica TaxID=348802 RepID=A0A0D2FA58_9EURO|nr:uncharacterized protein PV05_05525 [Exophiala xenobiotica]KIW56909.1 hypothetical protein PV05_05525 [Exophiala xenobiotica]